jgi:hypothetical protein
MPMLGTSSSVLFTRRASLNHCYLHFFPQPQSYACEMLGEHRSSKTVCGLTSHLLASPRIRASSSGSSPSNCAARTVWSPTPARCRPVAYSGSFNQSRLAPPLGWLPPSTHQVPLMLECVVRTTDQTLNASSQH